MDERSGAVNFGYLEQFTAGDQSFVREVLTVFCAEAVEWIERLDNDPENWARVIHTMKGTSRSVGADTLGDLCQYAESAGPPALPGVRAALDEVIVEVRRYLDAAG
jgi:HPt (histidine-containing phosphotransfer) domain-containing protein